jgi:PadR family transcriptional regulator PadR
MATRPSGSSRPRPEGHWARGSGASGTPEIVYPIGASERRTRGWAMSGPRELERPGSRAGLIQPGDLHFQSTLCRLTTMGRQDRDVRLSLQTLKVLEAFLENPTDQLSGADVQKRSRLASGTLYPILLRLESAGWFVSRWETIDPSSVGRPRRRLYRLTPAGLARASEVFASFGRGALA